MARKEKIIQVPEWGNRDAGKIFLIKEWPAARPKNGPFARFLLIRAIATSRFR